MTPTPPAMPVLLSGHLLVVETDGDGHVLRLTGPDAGLRLEIRVDANGPVLRLGAGARIELSGDLDIDARRVRLHGREGVTISSDQAVTVTAATDATVATRTGDVLIHAHDDVRIDGTRIRNNC